MLAVVAEILTHGCARVGRKELHRRRIGSGRFDHNRVIHRAEVLQCFHYLGYSRSLLADCDVDANYVLAFLVDDRVNGDSGLARLSISNDQLALTAADWHHSIDRFQTGL